MPKYRGLINEARKRLRENPGLGHHREGLPPNWRLFHISQRGRPARHFILYIVNRADNRVDVLRVLHDAMDAVLHRRLALVDGIRLGGARLRELSIEHLKKELQA